MRVWCPWLQHFFQMWPAVQKVCPPLYYNILNLFFKLKVKKKYLEIFTKTATMVLSNIQMKDCKTLKFIFKTLFHMRFQNLINLNKDPQLFSKQKH